MSEGGCRHLFAVKDLGLSYYHLCLSTYLELDALVKNCSLVSSWSSWACQRAMRSFRTLTDSHLFPAATDEAGTRSDSRRRSRSGSRFIRPTFTPPLHFFACWQATYVLLTSCCSATGLSAQSLTYKVHRTPKARRSKYRDHSRERERDSSRRRHRHRDRSRSRDRRYKQQRTRSRSPTYSSDRHMLRSLPALGTWAGCQLTSSIWPTAVSGDQPTHPPCAAAVQGSSLPALITIPQPWRPVWFCRWAAERAISSMC